MRLLSAALLLVIAAWQVAGSGFSISGTTILDANGNSFLIRGINHEHIWFTGDLDTALPAIAATGANAARVILAMGELWDKVEASTVTHIVELCEELKMICILDVHDTIGSDDPAVLEKAVDYWIEIFDVLDGTEDKVIINIANEWETQWDNDNWADSYKTAVPKLREAGYKHLFVIDCGGWGQNAESCATRGPEVAATDTLSNTMFSIHMYEVAGKDADTIKTYIDDNLANNIPVMIGEFGNDGEGVDVDYIKSYTLEKSVGWTAWSWYGNSDSTLDLATGPDGTLTYWGEWVINGDDGLTATAVVCSVFQ